MYTVKDLQPGHLFKIQGSYEWYYLLKKTSLIEGMLPADEEPDLFLLYCHGFPSFPMDSDSHVQIMPEFIVKHWIEKHE